MRILTLALAALAFSVCLEKASASGGVQSCLDDDSSYHRIQEDVPEENAVTIENADAEMVGVIEFTDSTKTSFQSLYLCGDNSVYYYFEGATSEIIGSRKGDLRDTLAYNDEYEVQAVFKTVSNDGKNAVLEMSVSVKWLGENEADADYPNFSAGGFNVVVPVPTKK